MFRIKNDEYNTVQLIPDFESSSFSGRKQKMSPAPVSSDIIEARKRRRRIIIAILAAILIAVVLIGKVVYDRWFAPPTLESYMEYYQAENYEKCADIARRLSGSSDFETAIRSSVLNDAGQAYSKYINGEAGSEETLAELTSLNEASAGLFDEDIGGKIRTVQDMNALYASISSVNNLVKQGDMEGLEQAYSILSEAKARGDALGTDPGWMLTSVIGDNIDGLKYYLFTRYAEEVRNGRAGIEFVEESAGFITSYVSDRDFENILSIMSDMRKGWHSAVYAEDAAQTVAAAAESRWRASI